MLPKVLKCKRTSNCCRLFVFTGVQVSDKEWKLLEKDLKLLNLSKKDFESCKELKVLPTKGRKPPKKCVFLKEPNICLIYKKRPQNCREYPIMIQRYKTSIVFHISDDCPRGERLFKMIKESPPKYLKNIIGSRKVKVVLQSFFEKGMQEYFDEEG